MAESLPPPPQADKVSARANRDTAPAERSARLLKEECLKVASCMGRVRSLPYELNAPAMVAAYSQEVTEQPQRSVAKAESMARSVASCSSRCGLSPDASDANRRRRGRAHVPSARDAHAPNERVGILGVVPSGFDGRRAIRGRACHTRPLVQSAPLTARRRAGPRSRARARHTGSGLFDVAHGL